MGEGSHRLRQLDTLVPPTSGGVTSANSTRDLEICQTLSRQYHCQHCRFVVVPHQRLFEEQHSQSCRSSTRSSTPRQAGCLVLRKTRRRFAAEDCAKSSVGAVGTQQGRGGASIDSRGVG